MAPVAGSAVLVCAVAAAAASRVPFAGVSCGTRACLFAGGCRSPHRVVCHLQNVSSKRFQLTPDTYPASLQELWMSGAQSVEIVAGTLRSLPNLQRLHLSSIGSVVLREDSMALASAARTNVTLDGVHRLTVSSRAFSDWHRTDCEVVLRNINQCHTASDAFPVGTSIPTVTLEHVASLSLAPGAFAASITSLRFVNVTLMNCQTGTFNGRLWNFFLHSVTLQRAERGCLHADGWHALTIVSSQLGHMTAGSFSGDISEVLLRDSSLRRLDGGGVSLNVTRFTAQGCRFGELLQEALWVTASRSVSLRSCAVGTLRRDAFRRLQLEGDDTEGVRIQQLRVDRADTGALRFASSLVDDAADAAAKDANATSEVVGPATNQLTLDRLDFGMPCACGAQERAHRLLFSGDEERHRAVPASVNLLLQSVLDARCVDAEHENTTTLAEFELSRCGHDRVPSARQAKMDAQYYAAAATGLTMLLLLMALISLSVQRHRSQTRRRRRIANKRRHCSPVSDDVWVVPTVRGSAPGVVGGAAGGRVCGASPEGAAATGKGAISVPRAPASRRLLPDSVSAETIWVNVRPPSEISNVYASIDQLVAVSHKAAGTATSDGRDSNDGDTCSSGPADPGPSPTAAAAPDHESKYDVIRPRPASSPAVPPRVSGTESQYDVVRGPPVHVACTCRWRDRVSVASRGGSSHYESPCTCRPRRVKERKMTQ